MANHVTNILKVTGSEEDKLAIIKLVSNGEQGFDLNRILPMPEALRNTEASSSSSRLFEIYLMQQLLVKGREKRYKECLPYMFNILNDYISEQRNIIHEALVDTVSLNTKFEVYVDDLNKYGIWDMKNNPDKYLDLIEEWVDRLLKPISERFVEIQADLRILTYQEDAEKHVINGSEYDTTADTVAAIGELFEEYGHVDWYSWSVENWGTKWNPYNAAHSGDGSLYTFDTAWSPVSAEVLLKLHEMFPETSFELVYGDEQMYGLNAETIQEMYENLDEPFDIGIPFGKIFVGIDPDIDDNVAVIHEELTNREAFIILTYDFEIIDNYLEEVEERLVEINNIFAEKVSKGEKIETYEFQEQKETNLLVVLLPEVQRIVRETVEA